MARSQSNGVLKFIGAAAAAIVGGVAIGYLVGGAHSPHVEEPIAQPPAPVISTPAPSVAPMVQRLQPTNGDYTAPGAPHIAIEEESAPILHRATPMATVATPDPEASQEANPLPTPKSQHLPASGNPPPDSNTSNPDGSNPGADTSGATTSAPANPGDTAPPAPDTTPTPPAPADPDFEHIGGQPNSQSGQDSSKALFRVQTGSYTDESNARSIADELRGKGYVTSTLSERDGDHLIYKVQVGAYRTKSGAGKAADDLQKKGYPAYVSPITPATQP